MTNKELNRDYVDKLRPSTNAVGIKYFKIGEEDQIEKLFPEVEYFKKPGMTCQAIGISAYYNKTVAVRRQDCAMTYCHTNNGLAPKDEHWFSGKDMATYPFEWFENVEASRQHTEAMNVGCPNDMAAIVTYSLDTCEVEPDVVALGMLPGAAYHLFAGLVEKEFRPLNFLYTQESGCTDAWGYTYCTKKPGLALGCRGDRSPGALPAHEVRVTLTMEDFKVALKGIDALAEREITYPYYPISILLDF